MFYLIPVRYQGFWKTLVTMTQENYETEDLANSSLIFAEYCKRPISHIKNELPKDNQRTIVYQLEPLVQNHWWNTEKIINNIRDADEVWDYDLDNIEVLKKHGIDAKFKPMRFTQSLQRVNNLLDPDIDVLFYGNVTDYRNKFFNWFWNATDSKVFGKLNFVWIKNFTDSKLDEFIGRSKIVLNLNPYDGLTRQQQPRIFYALINNKCVVSQKSPINYFGDSIYEFTNPHSLNNLLYSLLTDNKWREKNHNFNKCFAFQSNKLAVFIDVIDQENWDKNYEKTLFTLQQSSWYDLADFIHIGHESHLSLPYDLLKVNRLKKIEFGNDTLVEMIKFAKLNPGYKILYLDNDYQQDILTNHKLKEITDILEDNDLVYTSTKSKNFAARSEYIANLDIEFLGNVLTADQFINWLKRLIP